MGWGELFAVGAAINWAIAVILLRRSGESMPPFELNLVKNTVGFTLLLPTLALFSVRAWPGYPPGEVLTLLVSGLIGIAIADTWYLKALNLMGASRTGIVSTLYSPFTILLSALFLSEALTPNQWFGFALVMAGVLLVTWRRRKRDVREPELRRGVLYGAGAMAMMAVGVVMAKHILDTRPFLWNVEIRLVGGLAGMIGLVLVRGRTRQVIDEIRRPRRWGGIMVASVLATYIGMMLWLGGYTLTSVSVAAVLNESAAAFIVLFAWLFLKEPIPPRRLVGLALTMVGVLTMLLA